MPEYIEREALMDKLFRLPIMSMNGIHEEDVQVWMDGVADTKEQVREMIAEETAADVAPVVRGEWLDCENHNDIEQCSVCGMIYRYPTFYRYNYCPNCGARMDGGSK